MSTRTGGGEGHCQGENEPSHFCFSSQKSLGHKVVCNLLMTLGRARVDEFSTEVEKGSTELVLRSPSWTTVLTATPSFLSTFKQGAPTLPPCCCRKRLNFHKSG